MEMRPTRPCSTSQTAAANKGQEVGQTLDEASDHDEGGARMQEKYGAGLRCASQIDKVQCTSS